MENQQNAYKVEALELLAELESSLLELEAQPSDSELIDRVFRAMHTIKGSGAMFGYEEIAAFTHHIETAFDLVRDGRLAVTTDLVNAALQARDHIRNMLDGKENATEGSRILEAFKTIVGQAGCAQEDPEAEYRQSATVPAAAQNDAGRETGEEGGRAHTYRIRFKPHLNLFRNGTNPLLLLEEIRQLGACQVIAQTDRIPTDHLLFDAELCYLYWDIILTTAEGIDAIKDVFIFVEDNCDLIIDLLDSGAGGLAEEEYKKLGEILLERGDISASDLKKALSQQRRLGEVLIEEHLVDSGKIASALAEQNLVREMRQQRQTENTASVRVAAGKLDLLVDLVGELVTIQARLSQKAQKQDDPELIAISEIVERLTAEMRDNALSIRMLPIGTTLNKLRRLVRDLSNELGKDIVLQTEGGDTELDKTVIEQLNDPLVHIIRNCVDHGIEPPQVRKSAGKPAQGTIRLKAEHSGANVLIHISDDGAGIDPEAVRRKAIEKGLLSPEAERSEKELLNLIFEPGFSTAQSVTSVSGRGVGMDVVRRSIENLRGTVDLNSRAGKGTTLTLKLPLTLAIIDGLLVGIGEEKYILPLSAIEECVELTRRDVEKAGSRNILNIRGQIVPYIHLRQHFGLYGNPPNIEQVVINEVNGQRLGIVVDRVIGEHQIVIKSMSRLYKEIEEISGATILGDGSVALILDIQKLLQMWSTELQAA